MRVLDMREDYLIHHRHTRQRHKQILTVLAVLSFVVAIVVFWWLKLTGITITGEAFCNIQEHTHSGSCYEYTLICTDESEEHIHSAECTEEKLFCSLEEHIHTADCYSNPEADKETAADWESTFSKDMLSDSVAENILYIASTQLGYTESTLNYETDENGVHYGYSRYGEWYGNPYGQWGGMFVSFCIHYANTEHTDTLHNAGVNTMLLSWQSEGLYEEAAFHSVKTGELIFLDRDADGTADAVGVVSDYTDGVVTAIFGDWENSVSEVTVEDTGTVLGYGLADKLLTVTEPIEEEITEEETTEQAAEETTQPVEEETTDAAEEVTEPAPSPEPTNLMWSELIILYEASLDNETLSELNSLSEEDKKRVLELMYVIDRLPTIDDFYTELDRLYEEGDEGAEEDYILTIQNQAIVAYVTYQGLDELQSSVANADRLLELLDVFSNQPTMYVTGTTEALQFNYINHTWNISNWDTDVITPIIVHGGTVNEKVGSAVNRYWWGVVVEYDDVNKRYYVSEVYESEGGSTTSNAKILALEADTDKGFVILCWTADTSATTVQKAASNIISTVEVGDYVDISFDPTTVSSGYNTSGYGSFTFTEPPSFIEKPLEEIQNGELSDQQVLEAGGTVTSAEDDVQISKTIDGTNIENVFDITLTVRTETNVQSYLSEPDMAVVIVMDISETMNSYYPKTQTTTSRYDAAMVAAKSFIRQFAEQGKGISKLGFVAFNTHAHEILPMSVCTEDNVETLINTIENGTSTIINQSDYADLHTRFTNVEGGLQRGYDLLSSSGNENQYIVFLSDGFPTTYLKNGTTTYQGYDPYTGSGTKGADGVFYDYVQGKYCTYGTSYSDKAARKARTVATTIKNSGAKVFSIGIDIGGQTIQYYSDATLDDSYSIVDRESTTYEIGDASSKDAYKNWLQYSIGSGAETVTLQNENGESETLDISYYHDSTDQDSINTAFDNIFTAIGALNTQNRYTVWTSTDPLPVFDENAAIVEFIHFYEKDGDAAAELKGVLGPGEENTAFHKDGTIYWDLKDSGYTTSEETVGDTTTTYYYYTVTYRVRLYNEADQFEENIPYDTNGNAYLKYKTIVNTNGVSVISEDKTLNYPKPVVKGYYEGFEFTKQSDLGNPLAGAIFTLSHDDLNCTECHGNGQPVTTVNDLTYTSEGDGRVVFEKIPSGHIYNLEETVAPEGYAKTVKKYKVTVAMNVLSIRIYESAADTVGTLWSGDDLVVVNPPVSYILPETGSVGTLPFTICGLCLMAFPLLYCIQRRRKERRAKL